MSGSENEVLQAALYLFFPTDQAYTRFIEDELPIDDIDSWPKRLSQLADQVREQLGSQLTENIDAHMNIVIQLATNICMIPRLALYVRAGVLFLAGKGAMVTPDEKLDMAVSSVITSEIRQYANWIFGDEQSDPPEADFEVCEEIRRYFEEHHPYIKDYPFIFEEDGSCCIL